MYGRHDMVAMIDDPAYVLEDELVTIPFGCSPSSFLLHRYFWDGKIPTSQNLGHGNIDVGITAFTACAIPPPVTATVGTHRMVDLYPLSRPVSDSETVKCIRLKNRTSPSKFVTEAMKHLDDGLLPSEGMVFRGLSLSSLEMCLTFFVPIIHSNSAAKEFGPGIYATNDMAIAKTYAGTNGAIMVFRRPDERNLTIWRPDQEEWNRLTANWSKIPLENIHIPPPHQTADI